MHYRSILLTTLLIVNNAHCASQCFPKRKTKPQSHETKQKPAQSCMQPLPLEADVRRKRADELQKLMFAVPYPIVPSTQNMRFYEQRKNALLRFLDENAQLPVELQLPLGRAGEQYATATDTYRRYCTLDRWTSHPPRPYIPPLKGAVLDFDIDVDVVHRLIELKADVNHPDERGETPLMLADWVDIMRALIKAGAVNVYDVRSYYRDYKMADARKTRNNCIKNIVYSTFNEMLPIAFPDIPKDIAHLITDYVHGKPPEENVESITNLATHEHDDSEILEFERESNLIDYCSKEKYALMPAYAIKPHE